MTDFEIDWERERRTGIPEAVLCASKSASQIEAILAAAVSTGHRLLFTRLDPAVFATLGPETAPGSTTTTHFPHRMVRPFHR